MSKLPIKDQQTSIKKALKQARTLAEAGEECLQGQTRACKRDRAEGSKKGAGASK